MIWDRLLSNMLQPLHLKLWKYQCGLFWEVNLPQEIEHFEHQKWGKIKLVYNRIFFNEVSKKS